MIALLDQALAIEPADPEATKLKTTGNDALQAAKTKNGTLLAQADQSLRMGRTSDAKKLCDQALTNWPEDDRVEKMQKALDVLLAVDPPILVDFQRFILAGTTAMNGKRYKDAVTASPLRCNWFPTTPSRWSVWPRRIAR